jgi:hypothetical protein
MKVAGNDKRTSLLHYIKESFHHRNNSIVCHGHSPGGVVIRSFENWGDVGAAKKLAKATQLSFFMLMIV